MLDWLELKLPWTVEDRSFNGLPLVSFAPRSLYYVLLSMFREVFIGTAEGAKTTRGKIVSFKLAIFNVLETEGHEIWGEFRSFDGPDGLHEAVQKKQSKPRAIKKTLFVACQQMRRVFLSDAGHSQLSTSGVDAPRGPNRSDSHRNMGPRHHYAIAGGARQETGDSPVKTCPLR